ncbi:TRAP transporter small permease [Mesobacterium pallidum]|uniref:TRAP transporter small permease n=1 Tax=Mesobacterium pallidum TaxID=2872037 RepID=UPI001EE18169|nr:TRAP transporter small permease [Mesobacterium pallidum]
MKGRSTVSDTSERITREARGETALADLGPVKGPASGRTLALAAVLILVGNVVLTIVDVLMRWLLSQPQSWVSDIAELTYPVAIACCFPIALQTGSMIVVRFLATVVGPRPAHVLDLIGQALLALLLALFTWKVGARALSDWTAGYSTLTLKWPVAPTWAMVALLMAVSTFVQCVACWRLARKGHPDA